MTHGDRELLSSDRILPGGTFPIPRAPALSVGTLSHHVCDNPPGK